MIAAGTRLGPYAVTAPIGAGGMGEVYRATDTNLKRAVAIKVLPESVATDRDRLARFQREAQVLASLNHSNIAAIYGLERSGGVTALVMELVEGSTLADRIAQGPIPVDEALPIARQIAEALEAAHDQGIIHRDLKPANIKVRPDGTVKVLDFGLAKALEPVSAPADATASPTITSPAMMTGVGMLLGTAAYMSPEQARGKPIDKRSDIWAFGCVLYEMFTGKRAFEGETVSDTLASVLKSEPDWKIVPGEVPTAIRILLRRCLEKNRRKRLADISTALFILDEDVRLVSATEHPGSQEPKRRDEAYARVIRRRMGLVGVSALAVGVALTSIAAVWLLERPSAPRVARFTISPTGEAAITRIQLDRELAVTPDGMRIVYIGNSGTQLLVRALDQLNPFPIAGLGTPRGPFLSPDGQWIGFFDDAGTHVTIKKVTITGGPAVVIGSFAGGRGGATWSEDGTIVFATGDTESGLWRVSAAGGEVTSLTKPDKGKGQADHLWPEFLPGGRAVLFTIVPANADIDTAQVGVLNLETGAQKILVQGGSHAQYVSSGHLVYGAAGTLRAVAFDLERLEVTGTPVPVLSQVRTTEAGAANFDVADDGTLVYVVGDNAAASVAQRTLVWVDRQGREEAIKAPGRGYVYPRLSPDGEYVALEVRDQEDDIWIWSFARETLTRLTFGAGFDGDPAWTPDGRRVVFASNANGPRTGLFWQTGDGTGAPEGLVADMPGTWGGVSVSANGAVVFGGDDLISFPLAGDRRIQPLVQTSFSERNPEVSPDGRWLAYESNESGQWEIYVRPFPAVNSGRWQISAAGGLKPLWARNGQELFYVAPTGALMGVQVENGTTWRASGPARLLDGRMYMLLRGWSGRTYDVAVDAKRFLVIKPDPSEAQNAPIGAPGLPLRRTEAGLVVVQNWTEELKRLVPVN